MIDFNLYLYNSAIVAILMIFVWILSSVKKNAGIMDIFWGPGFVLVAWSSFYNSPEVQGLSLVLKIIVNVFVSLWGMRLGIHIFLRNHGKPEDYRYREMREKQGKFFPVKSLFTIFFFQGFIMLIVSFSVQFINFNKVHSFYLFPLVSGSVIWVVGFLFETVSDYQLKTFLSDLKEKGSVMNRGLWRYTRHPNYFGESAMWWGIFIISLSVPYGWVTIISPVLITFLLLRVSGVKMLEKDMANRRPEYVEYIKKTSVFFPRPPKG